MTAMIVQHTYGNPNPDTKSMAIWAKKNNITIIEDCTHVYRSNLPHNSLGSYGDGAFFSYSSDQGSCLGGIARLNNPRYLNVMSAIEKAAPLPTRQQSLLWGIRLFTKQLYSRSYLYRYVHSFASQNLLGEQQANDPVFQSMPLDYFKGMGSLQKRILDKDDTRIPEIINQRNQLAESYHQLLKALGLPVFSSPKGLFPYAIL